MILDELKLKRTVRLKDMAGWIDDAILYDPPSAITQICGQYYEPYYLFMNLAANHMSGLSVELGVDQGRGLASLALGSRFVVGIDHTMKSETSDVLQQFDHIKFLEQDSMPIPELLTQGRKISLLHIDTEHSYSMVLAEFEAYQPYLATPAIVIFDDLHAQEDAPLKYFSELPYPKIQDDRLHPTCGWGVVLYTG